MIRRSLSSASLLRLMVLMLCAATLAFLWGLHVSQKAAARQDALSAKAAEHLNLARACASWSTGPRPWAASPRAT